MNTLHYCYGGGGHGWENYTLLDYINTYGYYTNCPDHDYLPNNEGFVEGVRHPGALPEDLLHIYPPDWFLYGD